MEKPPICQVEGCERQRCSKGIHRGVRRYHRFCSSHRLIYRKTKTLPNLDKCVICGWDGPCDSHRSVSGDGYTEENTFIICPNCHRLLHRGTLTL